MKVTRIDELMLTAALAVGVAAVSQPGCAQDAAASKQPSAAAPSQPAAPAAQDAPAGQSSEPSTDQSAEPGTPAATVTSSNPSPPIGTQRLVSPGEDWGAVLARSSPGDQILLMPGEHRAVTIDSGGGSPEAPVIVRPLDPSKPILINGNRYGLRLRNVHDVILENLIIRGATLRGITISNGEPNPTTLLDDNTGGAMLEWAPVERANVVLRNIRVERTGPNGQRPAIMIQHVAGVEIANCVIEGWGGAAVEIVGARDVNVHDTQFIPLADHSQLHGVAMRAGSSGIHVYKCRFGGVSETVFQLGGGARAFEFIAPTEDEPEESASTLYGARKVVIERNITTDCGPSFGIVSAADVELRHNTIVRPRGHVVQLSNPPQDQLPLQPPLRLNFGHNLITWEPGNLTGYASIAEGFPVDTITMGRNLWWSAEEPAVRKQLEPFPGPAINPQVTKVDPLLDEHYHPHGHDTSIFGHAAR